MKKQLKGFSEQEVYDLYKYLCIYENKIKILKTSTEIYKQYPQLNIIEETLNLFTINYSNDEAMQILGIFVPKGFVYCTNTKSSKVYNLLYHLRNSIAHGQIEKENEQVLLIDYKFAKDRSSKRLRKVFSGRGNLDSSIVFKMIEIINNTIEL